MNGKLEIKSWLRETKLHRILVLTDILLSLAQWAPWIALGAGSWFWARSHNVWPGIIIFVFLICVGFVEEWIFFSFIKCTSCGHNPTRRKDGGRKKDRRASLRTTLENLTECPQCHQNV